MKTTLSKYDIHISLKEPEEISVMATSYQSAQTRAWRRFKSKLALKYKFHISRHKPVCEEPPTNVLEDIFNRYEDELFQKATGFDDAIIGVDEKSMRLIYSCKKCIQILIDGGMTREDAIEYFGFNVTDAYIGKKTPIWCEDDF